MLTDLLLPSTDAGVLAQAVGSAIALATAAVAVRRSAGLLWLVAGVAVMIGALMGVRALH